MEALVLVKKVRASSGITRKELARVADLSPSTISLVERGEMDPAWTTMQKTLAATGYQINGKTVVSSGETSAILSAVPLFTALFLRAEMRTSEATGSLAAASTQSTSLGQSGGGVQGCSMTRSARTI